MPTVYLARHATPDWSRSDLVYHQPPGPSLTPSGIAEAQAMGEFLKQQGVTRIFTSPLERCMQTARIAAQVCAIPVETLPDLLEWQPGEDRAAVRDRFWPAFENLVQAAAEDGPIAAVTHGGPVGVLLTELGMEPSLLARWRIFDHSNPLPPAGVWKASRCDADSSWKLELAFRPDQGSSITPVRAAGA